MKLRILFLLVLCSCVAHRASDRQNEAPMPVADQAETPPAEPDSLSQSLSDSAGFKPAIPEQLTTPVSDSLQADSAEVVAPAAPPTPHQKVYKATDQVYCPPCPPAAPKPRVIYRENKKLADSLRRELQTEKLANTGFRERLEKTEEERDYWREKNRQKFWTLIVMAIFAALYILFKVLASRIRNTEE